MLKRKVLLITILMIIVFVSISGAKQAYKIGGIFSSTGRASFLGDPEMKTMEMMIEKINANGGIDGHELEAIIYDSEGDPGKAVSAVNKLLYKDKVLAIIGPSTTPTTLAIVSFIERAKVPLISCAAGVKITDPIKPWVFKTAQTDLLAVSAVYQHIKSQGHKKIGIITVANSFGESGRDQLLNQADNFGLTIVKAETFGAKDTDTTTQLTKIKSAAPDAIVCWGTNPGPAVVSKNAHQLNIDIPLYQSHGVASPKFIDLAGESAEGIILPTGKILVADLLSGDDPQKEILDQYSTAYKTRWKGNVSGFGGYSYDAVNLLIKALKGSNGDKSKIRTNLESIRNHIGATGAFNFSENDHNGLGPDAFVLVEIRNGTWKLLE